VKFRNIASEKSGINQAGIFREERFLHEDGKREMQTGHLASGEQKIF
jgi:hypothetical protein